MANNIVRLPMDFFGNPTKGKPLAGGFVYVGEPDLDPEFLANRKTVTIRQEDGTEVPILAGEQPLNIGPGGYVLYLGGPVQLLTDGNYSIKVTDSLGAQKFYIANVMDGIPALITDVEAGDTVVTAAFEAADADIITNYEAADAAIAADVATNTADVATNTSDITSIKSGLIFDRTKLNLTVLVSLPADTSTTINWDSEILDESGSHDLITNPEMIIIPSGYNRARFFFKSQIYFGSDEVADFDIVLFRVSPPENVAGTNVSNNGLSDSYHPSFSSDWIDVVQGDSFRIQIYNAHLTKSANLKSLSNSTIFSCELASV